MKVIRARNAHAALPLAAQEIVDHGEARDSRVGRVFVHPEPVTTVYERSDERVLFHPERDANPFLHLFGALWMLAGSKSVDWLAQFAPNMRNYSDDGKTLHGAYGARWFTHFDAGCGHPGVRPIWLDQIREIALALEAEPDCRRQVLAMWDPVADLSGASKDIPCNTHVYFTRGRGGELDMTVCCRSNDIVWGCYGADVVDFGFLHEYMAARIGCPIGTYRQVSNNWHAYESTIKKATDVPRDGVCPYEQGGLRPFPLLRAEFGEDIETFDAEVRRFVEDPALGHTSPIAFIRHVATPMYRAWGHWKDREMPRSARINAALESVSRGVPCDWSVAAREWLERRKR